jgi:hypothetical protein
MIYIFKTTVKTNVQANRLKPHFDKLLPKAKWNFDLRDCENILCIDWKKHHFGNFKIYL